MDFYNNTIYYFKSHSTQEVDLGQTNKSISSYFAQSQDDIFDSLGGAEAVDMFSSIAISKSEEDIRASEMNAREINESDVIPDAHTPGGGAPGMPRVHSFLRKQEEEEQKDLSSLIESNNKALCVDKMADIGESVQEEVNIDDEVQHIHVRERHKSTSCEPESITFAGKYS